eukprot:5128424-Pyramimonas_sp.AAC.1
MLDDAVGHQLEPASMSFSVLPLGLCRDCLHACPHGIHGLLELLVDHAVRVKPDCQWWSRCPQLPEDLGNCLWLAVLEVARHG